LKKKLEELTEIQRHVTQENGTERPFENPFWDHFEEGLYLDIVSGEVLFASCHKFKSSCGWPSFYKSIERDNLVHVEDRSLGVSRVEVRSKLGDSHLGHVFTDGPAPTGIRYCINSASLEFVGIDELKTNDFLKYKEMIKGNSTDSENADLEIITLGGGCFWGVEAIFSKTIGVLDAVSGYCGGLTINPTYEDICTGESGHAEVVQVTYDKNKITTTQILELFFKLHDPTTKNSQGYDTGTQYRSVIYFSTDEQERISRKVMDEVEKSGFYPNPIVTEITKLNTFYSAEEYHQDYYDKKYSGGHGPICHFVRGE
jgi:peptide methionine sulfoxide reductase msrA/msrB